MADYRELYLQMFRATEQAINILIAAQQECEEAYINAPNPIIKILDKNTTADTQKNS